LRGEPGEGEESAWLDADSDLKVTLKLSRRKIK
jgi:hypothetical protein